MHRETTSRRVPIQRPRDIPVSRERLLRTLTERIESDLDKEQFTSFCGRLEQRLHADFLPQLKELKRDFKLFSDSGGGSGGAGGAAQLRRMNEEEIAEAEDLFLRGFLETMRQAGYRLLGQGDVDVARQESYLLDLPLSVNWKGLDDELLARYWQHNEYAASERPEFADRLLALHRGVGVDRATAVHFWPKLKLLFQRAFSTSYQLARGKLAQLGTKRITPLPSRDESDDSAESKPPSAYSPPPDEPITTPAASTSIAPEGDPLLASTPPAPAAEGEAAIAVPVPAEAPAKQEASSPEKCPERPSQEFPEQFIERIALKDLPLGIGSLRQQTLIQEPTYQELVLLYRQATPADVKDRVTDKDRRIHIKSFRDVPQADLEVVFPESRIDQRTEWTQWAVGIGAVVLGVLLQLAPWWAGLLGLVSLALGVKSLADISLARYQFGHLYAQAMQRKGRNDDLGLLLALIDHLEERQYKSAALAYFYVWRQGVSSVDELKQKCEALLEQEYGQRVDFDASAAIKALTDRGLLTHDDERLSAVPPEEAVRKL
jgi:hypothetical protein